MQRVTNNSAELAVAGDALRGAHGSGLLPPGRPLHVFGDSELVINFLCFRATAKRHHLASLVQAIRALRLPFRPRYVHVPRPANALADFLANVALVWQRDVSLGELGLVNRLARGMPAPWDPWKVGA